MFATTGYYDQGKKRTKVTNLHFKFKKNLTTYLISTQ